MIHKLYKHRHRNGAIIRVFTSNCYYLVDLGNTGKYKLYLSTIDYKEVYTEGLKANTRYLHRSLTGTLSIMTSNYKVRVNKEVFDSYFFLQMEDNITYPVEKYSDTNQNIIFSKF